MDLDLRQLRYFLEVADRLHFSRAATALGIAQPALSQQIQRLESTLETQLLTRTSRAVTLTPAGLVLRERSRSLLRQAALDIAEVRRVGDGEQGNLTIGLVTSALSLGPFDQVREFRECYPLVNVQIRQGFTAALTEMMSRGEVDVAFVRDPEETASVHVVHSLIEPFLAIVPKDHPLAGEPFLTGAQLRHEPFIMFPAIAGTRALDLNLRPVLESGSTPRIVQEASTWSAIIHLVGAGLGVTIAPTSAAIGAPDTVRVIELRGTEARSTLAIIVRADEDRAIVRNFLRNDFLRHPDRLAPE